MVTNGSQPVEITLLGFDPKVNGTLTFSIVSPPVFGTLSNITGATLTYTPLPKLLNVVDSFTYKATNSAGLSSNIGTVTIKLNPPSRH